MPRSDTPSQPRLPPSSTLFCDQGYRFLANTKGCVLDAFMRQQGNLSCHWDQATACNAQQNSQKDREPLLSVGVYLLSNGEGWVCAVATSSKHTTLC